MRDQVSTSQFLMVPSGKRICALAKVYSVPRMSLLPTQPVRVSSSAAPVRTMVRGFFMFLVLVSMVLVYHTLLRGGRGSAS